MCAVVVVAQCVCFVCAPLIEANVKANEARRGDGGPDQTEPEPRQVSGGRAGLGEGAVRRGEIHLALMDSSHSQALLINTRLSPQIEHPYAPAG